MNSEKVISNIKKAIKEHFDSNYTYDMLVDFELDVIEWYSLFEYIDKLKQENKQLQEELKLTIGIVEHNRIISGKNKEIYQLKDNWNKLKEYIDKMHEYFLYTDVNEIYKQNMKVDNPFPNLFNLSELNASDRILSSICKKMQELEQGSDSNE